MSSLNLDTVESIIEHVVVLEGGFVDDPEDSGGATRFGITEAVARAHGYKGDMRNLPKAFAIDVYRQAYWTPLRLDQVLVSSPAIALELFDTAVNSGVSRAGEFLQRSLNVLNRRGKDYDDITVDGLVGPKTLAAYEAYRRVRARSGEKVLLRALNCLQGAFYIDLAERRQKDQRFIFGWLLHRVVI